MDSINKVRDSAGGQDIIWAIDPVHSRIRFDARYLLISNVSGWFNDFEGTVSCPGDGFNNCRIRLAIYTNSIDTGNGQRDGHLRSPDFFDAVRYPVIGFHSESVKMPDGPGGKQLEIDGIISIRDIQRPVRLQASWLGTVPDPMGNLKAGFTLNTLLDRKEFDLSWNQRFDNSGLLLSDEIRLQADIQLMRLSHPDLYN